MFSSRRMHEILPPPPAIEQPVELLGVDSDGLQLAPSYAESDPASSGEGVDRNSKGRRFLHPCHLRHANHRNV
jgi:hypothetical protein